MIFNIDNSERTEAYRVLSQFYAKPPDKDALTAIKQDFSLDFTDTIEKITEDFEALFAYPGGSLQPVESLFAPLLGIAYSDVNDFYASAGLIIADHVDMASDHLSLELLFMSYLIENNKTAVEQIFLEQHLMNWVPYYCDMIAKQAKTLFYREIANISKNFLTAEYEEYTD
jgi:TorA maturation chaperone TorD